MIDMRTVAQTDPELAQAMMQELDRQRSHLELIASENFVSPAVMAAMGSHLTNKYAEGYPGKRYYGGCAYVDVAEELARTRACQLFGADHANVQPHSGAQANLAVYFALLDHGDTILGMNLAHGGHLTHGSPVNMSGKYFHIVPYGVREDDQTIDYDALREKLTRLDPALQREFDRFADEQLDLRPMDLEEQFLMGFRLGARLMIEVLDQPET